MKSKLLTNILTGSVLLHRVTIENITKHTTVRERLVFPATSGGKGLRNAVLVLVNVVARLAAEAVGDPVFSVTSSPHTVWPESGAMDTTGSVLGRIAIVSANNTNSVSAANLSEDAAGDADWDAGTASGGIDTIPWLAETTSGGLAGALEVDLALAVDLGSAAS